MSRPKSVEGRKTIAVVFRGNREQVNALSIIALRRKVHQGDLVTDALRMWAVEQLEAEDAEVLRPELDLLLADPA